MKLLITILVLFPLLINAQSKIFAINSSPPIVSLPGGGDTTVVCVNPTFSFKSNWLADNLLGLYATSNYVTGRIGYDATTPTWHGRPSAKVEVRRTDNNSTDIHTSCPDGECERSEVAEMPDGHGGLIDEATAIGDTVYYGMSYNLPPDWSTHTDPGNYQVIFQQHGPDVFGINPLCGIYIDAAKAQFVYRSGDITVDPNLHPRGIPIGNNAYDKWTDLIIVIYYQKTATGFFKVYRRDEGATGWQLVCFLPNISTYQYDPSVSGGAILYHYWKQGLYRGSVNRTDTYHMGPTVRALTFADAECAAFGTNNGVAN